MRCKEKQQLLAAYRLATEHYTHAVKQFKDNLSSVNFNATEDLFKLARDAHEQSEASRISLEDHILDDGC